MGGLEKVSCLLCGASGQARDDDVVDVGARDAVGAAVVLEGGDDPALGLDWGEAGEAGALEEFKCCVVGGPGAGPDCLEFLPELLGSVLPSGVECLHGGVEGAAVIGGEVGWGLPDEVGDLAVGAHALQDGDVDVGAQGEGVIGAG